MHDVIKINLIQINIRITSKFPLRIICQTGHVIPPISSATNKQFYDL